MTRTHCVHNHPLSGTNVRVEPSGRRRCRACERARSSGGARATPEARRRYHLKEKFGLTVEEYDAMLRAQDGRCAICRHPPTAKRLAVDHDHRTGMVRGLLCEACNWFVGQLEKQEEHLDSALTYLEQKGGRSWRR